MTETIHTDRLALRPFAASDADRVARLIGNYEVSTWLTRVPYPYTHRDALDFFAAHSGNDDVCAVTLDGDVIGAVSILHADLGYWYGVPFWGCGYATEAARALLARHFARSDETVNSGYLDGNAGSRKVLTKLGFAPDGSRMTSCLSRGSSVLNHRVTLTRVAWKAAA